MFKMCFRSRVPAIPRLRLSLSRSAEAVGDLSFSNSDQVQQQTFLFSNCTANTDTAQICTPAPQTSGRNPCSVAADRRDSEWFRPAVKRCELSALR